MPRLQPFRESLLPELNSAVAEFSIKNAQTGYSRFVSVEKGVPQIKLSF